MCFLILLIWALRLSDKFSRYTSSSNLLFSPTSCSLGPLEAGTQLPTRAEFYTGNPLRTAISLESLTAEGTLVGSGFASHLPNICAVASSFPKSSAVKRRPCLIVLPMQTSVIRQFAVNSFFGGTRIFPPLPFTMQP